MMKGRNKVGGTGRWLWETSGVGNNSAATARLSTRRDLRDRGGRCSVGWQGRRWEEWKRWRNLDAGGEK